MFHQVTNTKRSEKVIQFIILCLIVISITTFSYIEYKNTIEETTDKLNEKFINFHFETFSKLSDIFLRETHHNFKTEVMAKKELRDRFEDMLRLISVSTVQNLFVVTRDKDNNYFILLDSDNNSQTRSNIFEPFNPLGDLWDHAYKYKASEVFHHDDNKDLWITIAYPIVQNNITVAIIGADISHKLDTNMQTKLHSFGTFFFWIMLLGIGWFIILYLITIYLRQKVFEGYIDTLTTIYNRRYLNEVLLKKLSRNYQLFMLDIDFFKNVNDTYGHEMGDYVLKEVALRMKKLVREEDALIRFGGEEFLIYTTELSFENSVDLAQRLRKSIETKSIKYKDKEVFITISIGVNHEVQNNESFDDVLRKADDALYRAKMDGRNCVRVAK